MRRARLVFLLGSGRCGSTLIAQVLAHHADVGFISNIDDRVAPLNLSGRANNRIYRALPRGRRRLGGVRAGVAPGFGLTPSEGYRLLDRQVSPLLSAPCRDLVAADGHPWLADRLQHFFEGRATAQRRSVFMHKFTGWPRAGLLHRVFPDARFVHVVRDGRAVASSLIQQRWWPGYAGPSGWTFGELSADDARIWAESGQSFAVLAGLEWKILMDAFTRARDSVSAECWLELRYEQVVQNPHEAFKLLLDHAGLAWTAEFERDFSRITWESTRRDAYLNELSSQELNWLEGALGPVLRRLGY